MRKIVMRGVGATAIAALAIGVPLAVSSAPGNTKDTGGQESTTEARASFEVFDQTTPQSSEETHWITEYVPASIQPAEVRLAQSSPSAEIGVLTGSGAICVYARQPGFDRAGGCSSISTAAADVHPLIGTAPAPTGGKLLFGVFPNDTSNVVAHQEGSDIPIQLTNNTASVHIGGSTTTVTWTTPDGATGELHIS